MADITYTRKTIRIIPAGKSLYTSEILTEKFGELQADGDLISRAITTSGEFSLSTSVWKSETVYNAYSAWLETSGEAEKWRAHETLHGITNFIESKL